MELPSVVELGRIGRDLHRLAHELRTFHSNPITELETILASLDELQALGPRLDAIKAAIGTDTQTAVAAAVAPLNEQITNLAAAAQAQESQTSAVASDLTDKVAGIETALGIAAPASAGGGQQQA